MDVLEIERQVVRRQFRKRMKNYLLELYHSKFVGDSETDHESEKSPCETDTGCNCILGRRLEELYHLVEEDKSSTEHAEDVLEKIIEIRCNGKPEEMKMKMRMDYETFLRIREEREQTIEESIETVTCLRMEYKLEPVSKLHDRSFWGTRQQMRSGKIVGDFLGGLDAVFGVLLNVTGGRIGSGDTPWFHKLLFVRDFPLAYHAAVHDGFGYLLSYHGKGPGYNYLKSRWTLFGSASPMSCQLAGVNFWRQMTIEPAELNVF